jgi:hypothetical protein
MLSGLSALETKLVFTRRRMRHTSRIHVCARSSLYVLHSRCSDGAISNVPSFLKEHGSVNNKSFSGHITTGADMRIQSRLAEFADFQPSLTRGSAFSSDVLCFAEILHHWYLRSVSPENTIFKPLHVLRFQTFAGSHSDAYGRSILYASPDRTITQREGLRLSQ